MNIDNFLSKYDGRNLNNQETQSEFISDLNILFLEAMSEDGPESYEQLMEYSDLLFSNFVKKIAREFVFTHLEEETILIIKKKFVKRCIYPIVQSLFRDEWEKILEREALERKLHEEVERARRRQEREEKERKEKEGSFNFNNFNWGSSFTEDNPFNHNSKNKEKWKRDTEYERRKQQRRQSKTRTRTTSSYTNCFTVLGLSISATEEQVKSAYRKLSMEYHPDKGGSQEKFVEITNAKNECMKILQK